MVKWNTKINITVLGMIALILLIFMGGCGNSTAPEQETTSEQQTEQPAAPVAEKTSEENKGNFIMATTTSTQDSGLLDVLVPIFEEQTGYMVKTIAVGTGKALEMGQNGEADVLLVHAPESEKPLVDSGVAVNYQLVMHNDFVIVGPSEDPAGIKGAATAVEAFTKIAQSENVFASRGDDSGTHKKELTIWKNSSNEPGGQWYQETGQGMGSTLKVASEKGGYTLTDRATYLALKDDLELEILIEGEENLLNIYHVMQVNPEKFEMINGEAGKAFVEFMIAPETQEVIGEFGVEEFGQPLFFPDAVK
ncbi:substrate-binding domain-containing protein [Bacillus sp. Marseille-P3661]|uniref:substrate-binding domain-containing protein n=1 Tax=Bacillus sp. Marseille-P3661 TaxID=1936234 RepID=UPI000C85AB40|nr:substrate-binding domain-containing protein [Bacillus sp. Marseille-P3661]